MTLRTGDYHGEHAHGGALNADQRDALRDTRVVSGKIGGVITNRIESIKVSTPRTVKTVKAPKLEPIAASKEPKVPRPRTRKRRDPFTDDSACVTVCISMSEIERMAMDVACQKFRLQMSTLIRRAVRDFVSARERELEATR